MKDSNGEYAVVQAGTKDLLSVNLHDRREYAICQAKARSALDGRKYLVLKVIGYSEQQPTRAVWVDLEDK